MEKPYYEKQIEELSNDVTLTIPHIIDALKSLQGQHIDIKQATHNIYEIIEHLGIEQCKECGVPVGVEDDLYGGGYCDGCSMICFDCDCYFSINQMICIDQERQAYICQKCGKKRMLI